MKVLICGGREYNGVGRMFQVLEDLDSKRTITSIISGGARGADSIAEMYAKQNGKHLSVYRADWDRFGKSAGFKRNYKMLHEGKPDLIVAFPGGKGTKMMTMLAEDAGVEVIKVDWND